MHGGCRILPCFEGRLAHLILLVAMSPSDLTGADDALPSKGRGRNFTAKECFILARAWVQQSLAVDEQSEATFWPGVLVNFEKGGGTLGRTSTSLRSKWMEDQMQAQNWLRAQNIILDSNPSGAPPNDLKN
jgi:hypothetical protein